MRSFGTRTALAAAALAALGACTPSAVEVERPARAASPRAAPVARTRAIAGTETVIGRTAAALTAQFGRPGLDIREGTARKLQFESNACVLDAYLYPPAAGGEPIVTHIDARLPDGRDMDRASCVAALTAARGR